MPTLCDHIDRISELPEQLTACRYYRRKNWQKMSWRQVYFVIESVTSALFAQGLKPGDRVAIWGDTCLEWWLLDLALMKARMISVPIYHNCSLEEAISILKSSQAKALFFGNSDQFKSWDKIRRELPQISHLICLSTPSDWDEKLIFWDDFLESGDLFFEENQDLKDFLSSSIDEDLPVTLVYTSGTTGEPRGFSLSHRQIMSELEDVFRVLDLDENDRALSFLPYSHIMGRLEGWGSIFKNYTITFSRGISQLDEDLRIVKPTVIMAVPRVFEKIFEQIRSKANVHRFGDAAFVRAQKVAREISLAKMKRNQPSMRVLAEFLIFDRIFFAPLRAAFGGSLRFALSGGAPLNKELIEFFHGAGVLILQGYGLTETTGAITLNTPIHYRHGSVGRPLDEVEVKIADDGEVLVKSTKVAQDILTTSQSLSDHQDFFATGDIGFIDDEKFLFITDRKKDLIKTSNGKYVAPQKIENLLRHQDLISQAIIYGDQKKYIVAAVTLNRARVLQKAASLELSFQNFSGLSQHPRIFEEVKTCVAAVNRGLAPHETIKNFVILPKDLTVEEGELTPSFKVKRKKCIEKFKDLFERLY